MGYTGIILAGGKSSRFGSDKTRLEWNHRPLLEELTERFSEMFDQVVIVSGQKGKFKIQGAVEAVDRYSGKGPLGGIHAGLLAAEHEACFVMACDMPFFDGRAARLLLEYEKEYDIVVPVRKGRMEPLFAVYHKHLVNKIERQIEEGRCAVRSMYEGCHVREVEADAWEGMDHIFDNINYHEDYVELEKLISMYHEQEE